MLEEVGIPRLVVAGISSGSGKTSITLGLVTALRARGRTVQTFKVGPDFIDCAYLAHASRRPCRNLDSWMLGQAGVRRTLARGVMSADCAVVEGVGGLYDGHGRGEAGASSAAFPGSTAEVARLIAAPVVLVLDAWYMGETAAAIALGIKQLDVSGSVVGVILNNVPSDYRRRVVEDAVWNMAHLPVLGALPRLDAVHIPEVRTGLLPLAQNPHVDEAIELLGRAVQRHCDLDLIERLMSRAQPLHLAPARAEAAGGRPVRVGVAFDDAFCFYYAENLEMLEEAGAEVVTFSPLEDRGLPRDLDALYLGGGVSEAYVPRLSGNRAFIESYRRARSAGIPTYAECGGVLYSARSLRTSDGSVHAMAGVIPVDIALEAGSLHTGYRDVRIAEQCMLGAVGTRLRGHEYHFARLLSATEGMSPAYNMHDSDGEPLGCEGWTAEGITASLVHLHFGQDPMLARRIVDAARSARQRREARSEELSAV
ncbi:MAG: cobyrinate a,c-diamide synthase [Candidatus Dormibacteraeota bacterium]|nr:cobyrinate a,c-diamide synthase [Candidatus Dormibacteraeota bacterium]MBV9524700.1 cobyrinate a,c-diamide synthase [Candidatus Dormibacteraeota bacterium]